MEKLASWWCDLLGVTDPDTIAVVAGIFAATPALVLVYVLLVVTLGFINGLNR